MAGSIWARNYMRAGPDVTLVLGTDLDDSAMAGTPPVAADGILIHVDIDPSVFGRNFSTAFGAAYDVGAFSRTMTSFAEGWNKDRYLDLAAKRLEILREVLPGLQRLAVMVNADYSGGVTEGEEIDAAGRKLGLELIAMPIRSVADIAPAFEGLKGRAQALNVTGDPLVNAQRLRINTFALAARLPSMFSQRQYLEAGGLMSYGPSFPDLNRRAADYVNKVLRGAKPADLPVEQPTRFDLVINLITARALEITVPPSLLVRADEVIE